MRESGVLLPVFSLPGEYSCGSFGEEAFEFVDFLADAGFSWWQLLPVCKTDGYRSPYMSPASFAGEETYISLSLLEKKGLLTKEELQSARQHSPYLCEWDRLAAERLFLLRKAFARLADRSQTEAFLEKNPAIARACEFLALKEQNGGAPWQEWKTAEPDRGEVLFRGFLQQEFFGQFFALKEYANRRGVKLLGDLPFYVSSDSADVWENRESFLLDKKGRPRAVAGVPPDYFSPTGQTWGNPLYNWRALEKNGFSFWRKRLSQAFELYDGLRLDHFRAFAEYWSIPASSPDARSGEWKKGPGEKMIRLIRSLSGGKTVVAENLGIIDEKVNALLEKSTFPGMSVLQFGFDGNPRNPHLPHAYPAHTLCTTGTHDNATFRGFLWEAGEEERKRVLAYMGYPEEANWDGAWKAAIQMLLRSSAELCIFPVQDLLGFGNDTRTNAPGTVGANWSFRLTKEAFETLKSAGWGEMNRLYARGNGKKGENAQ